MSKHVEEARGFIEMACAESDPAWSSARAQVAQAEATLAVAEQQRIANIVALGALQIASSMDGYGSLVGDGGAFRALYPSGSNTPLHPEIARALGLGVGDE